MQGGRHAASMRARTSPVVVLVALCLLETSGPPAAQARTSAKAARDRIMRSAAPDRRRGGASPASARMPAPPAPAPAPLRTTVPPPPIPTLEGGEEEVVAQGAPRRLSEADGGGEAPAEPEPARAITRTAGATLTPTTLPALQRVADVAACRCHNNPFLVFDPERSDCFDPWHKKAFAPCSQLCNCYGRHYDGGWVSELDSCVNVTLAADLAPDASAELFAESAALRQLGDARWAEQLAALRAVPGAVPSCVGARTICADDPFYRDPEGDDCTFYAALPDPFLACSYPGYEAALDHCPKACGVCIESNETSVFKSRLHEMYPRYFDVQPGRSRCGARNNLGQPLDAHNAAPVSVRGLPTVEKCAQACVEFGREAGLEHGAQKPNACVAFGIRQWVNNSQTERFCEFTSECTGEAGVQYDGEDSESAQWTTYTVKPPSDCDPLPGSVAQRDRCGVCGGDNSTCAASLELLIDEPIRGRRQRHEESLTALGRQMAKGRFQVRPVNGFGEVIQTGEDEAAPNCTATPLSSDCRIGDPDPYTVAHCYLHLFGSSHNASELTFAFGSHPGGTEAHFQLAEPRAEDIGELERVVMYLVGGEHWLDGTGDKTLRGIRLTTTLDSRRVEWELRLEQPVTAADPITVVTWDLVGDTPTTVSRCHNDCSGTGTGGDDEGTELGMPYPHAYGGCTHRCSSVFDFSVRQKRLLCAWHRA